MTEKLARYLRGWIGYFGNCETPSTIERLEEWTRRRLRTAIWKQWMPGPKRSAELVLANSPALAIVLPNTYSATLGIPPLTALPLAQPTESPYTGPVRTVT